MTGIMAVCLVVIRATYSGNLIASLTGNCNYDSDYFNCTFFSLLFSKAVHTGFSLERDLVVNSFTSVEH